MKTIELRQKKVEKEKRLQQDKILETQELLKTRKMISKQQHEARLRQTRESLENTAKVSHHSSYFF